MSDPENPSSAETDELVDKIHEIQEEIFEREDQIDELVDATELQESLLAVVEEGKTRRHRLHMQRLHADWQRMVERSRGGRADHDFELAAALVHFVGDILISQTDGTDYQWINQLKEYLEQQRQLVN